MSLFGDDDIIYDDDLADDAGAGEGADDGAPQRLVEPSAMHFCLGHEKQEQNLLDLYEKDSLPHAMIFSGPQGIGKTTMAFRLARFLLKHGAKSTDQDSLFGGDALPQTSTTLDVEADNPVAIRVASGGHGDLLRIARHYDAAKGKQDAALKVEALRKIEPFLRKTSSAGGWRIVIVEDADTMNRSAQNAILKILEEPPANVLIILIAHRPGMLIPTIHSRARVIPFSPLSEAHMAELLARQGHKLGPDDMAALSALSEGSIGLALRYIDEGGLTMLYKVLDHLDDYPRWNWARIHALSSSLSSPSQDKDYRMFVEVMQWIFREVLFSKARGGQQPPSYLNNETLSRMMSESPLEKLVQICDGLKEHFERTDFSNLDRRDAVRGSFLVISE